VNPEVRLLVGVLDAAFSGHGWQGATLTGALRGLTAKQALKRPAPGRHNVWELTLHAAYWKYVVCQRLTGSTERGAFPRGPSNFPAIPGKPDDRAWRDDVRLLKQMHARLRAAVKALPPRMLGKRSPSGKWTYAEMIYGIAAHDLYHTGQIQLVKRLAVSRSR
jgi:hypothetical protein